MPGADGQLETAVSLLLAESAPALAEAHWETYPERIPEAIPFSITLLYPFVAQESLTAAHVETLREFFAKRCPLEFELTHLAEIPGAVVYAVPEPDRELRSTMRALWALFPEHPPYGRPDSDPPPHASLALLADKDMEAVRNTVARRVDGLLPATCATREVSLFEEYAPDRWRVRERFPLGG